MTSTALVLAGGLGQRLQSVTDGPKWLVPVGAATPMSRQLEACIASPVISSVLVVTGPDQAPIAEAADPYRDRIPMTLVPNLDSDRWNNWSSALLGIDTLGPSDPIILFNSDLFAATDWFVAGIAALETTTGAALLIDHQRELTDESMKVAGVGRLKAIGKVGIDDPTGEYVGMARWDPPAAESFATVLRGFRSAESNWQNWYEHGVDAQIRAGVPYTGVPTPSSRWVEIDEPADVGLAQRLVG